MADGCRLAARIWLPAVALGNPVPAILEYIPYRKRDFTRARDEPIHYYFAGHGYAAVRVDIRGSGDSDGLLLDEYDKQEQDDALEVIRWIAQQPWCNGAVGMMGKSWGGFNSLQVAARRPPELKAIISVCSSDDRYTDDAHYMGGCLLNENLTWGSVLMSVNACPPDPEIVGDQWRDMWRERLEHAVFFPEVWLTHQRRDDYWQHGSVNEDYGAIVCPVYVVGGWADAYSNAIPRLLSGLKTPRKGLIGPWAHLYPQDGVPGPAIGFLQEALRWWDYWLKGIDNGIMSEPMLRFWMQQSVRPQPFHDYRPGRWVAEPEWPSMRIVTKRYWLNPGRMSCTEQLESSLCICSPQTTGLRAGNWCGFGIRGEAPPDQREDDAGSLSFDSDPLTETMEIFGAPSVTLNLACDQPLAIIAVRLNDVSPDGASTRVTYGLLNLTRHHSDQSAEPLEPGKRYRVAMRLNHIAHAFSAGHKLRLTISTSYWPIAWPTAHPVIMTVYTGESSIDIPVRPPDPKDDELRPFGAPEQAPMAAQSELRPAVVRRRIEKDLVTNETVYTVLNDSSDDESQPSVRFEDIDLDLDHTILQCFRIADDNPLSASAEVVQKILLRRGAWKARVETRTRMTATENDFLLQAEVLAYADKEEFFARTWERRIKRDLL